MLELGFKLETEAFIQHGHKNFTLQIKYESDPNNVYNNIFFWFQHLWYCKFLNEYGKPYIKQTSPHMPVAGLVILVVVWVGLGGWKGEMTLL